MKTWILTIIFFFLLAVPVFAYPSYQGYVNDFGNVLSPAFEETEEAMLSDYDKKTTNQIAIATIDTTAPETIEEYSIHLADQWKPGQKGKDNGVLMVFAMRDHKMRIEVGRGLEGELTDIESKHILDDVIKPEFKAGHFEAGISRGTDAVILAIATQSATPVSSPTGGAGDAIIFLIFFVLVIIVIIIAISPFTPFGGEGSWGYTGGWSSSSSGSSGDSGGASFGGGSSSGGGASGGW